MAGHSTHCQQLLERAAAQLRLWETKSTGLSTFVTSFERIRSEIPHDRFRRASAVELDAIVAVYDGLLAEPRRGPTEVERAALDAAFTRLHVLLDAARREIDDPCRDGQSCRS